MAGYSAVGSALPWGGRGRGFKSRYSDQIKKGRFDLPFFICTWIMEMTHGTTKPSSS